MKTSHSVPLVEQLKQRLVGLGPGHPLLQLSLKAFAIRHGFRVVFYDSAIGIRRGSDELRVPLESYIEVPIMMECFDQFFVSVQPKIVGGLSLLDFSRSGVHTYKRSGVEFVFPGIPEEDSMDAYAHWYRVKPGDVVWDVGAHAGATTYFLAQAVGPTGHVFAFEPDSRNFQYLCENISRHNLSNVTPVKKALSGASGTVMFQADGTMSSGIREYLNYQDRGRTVEIEALSLADACVATGAVPAYVKMDIEGAEVAVIEGAAQFLKNQAVHFAIESYHVIDGRMTYKALDRLFPEIGYDVYSSDSLGQMFTWARRKQ